jgi:hypothetical protein
VETAAPAIGLQVQVLNASNSREIKAAFATFVRERPDALLVGGDPFSRRVQLVNLTSRHARYAGRQFPDGGPMTTDPTLRMRGVRSAPMSAASSRARSRRTCRSYNQPSLSW